MRYATLETNLTVEQPVVPVRDASTVLATNDDYGSEITTNWTTTTTALWGPITGIVIPDIWFTPVFTEGNDTFGGTPNDDNYNALGGNDTIFGSAGADTIDGGNGFDTVDYTASALGVMLDMQRSGPVGITGDAEGDTLINVEHIVGSALGDVIIANHAGMKLEGGAGDDWLTGGSRNDWLEGGAGDDTLRGDFTGSSRVSSGLDSFVVGLDTGSDLIVDFQSGQDEIVVRGLRADDAFGRDGVLAIGFWDNHRDLHAAHLDGDRLFYDVHNHQLIETVNGQVRWAERDVIASFLNEVELHTFDFSFV